MELAQTQSHIAAEDEKENVDDKGKKPMREEDLPQDQAEGEEEADDSPGSRTDMELAWENLEVAKYIYEHESSSTFAKELAGDCTSLAYTSEFAVQTCKQFMRIGSLRKQARLSCCQPYAPHIW